MITGVYAIRNKINGKRYVGSAALSLRRRWIIHRSNLRRGIHHNRHLQAAWNKYGEEEFEFIVLSRCRPEACTRLEQQWMNHYRAIDPRCGYNLYSDARSPLGLKRPSHVGAAVASANRGRKVSDETRAKMSASQSARTDRPLKEKGPQYGHWTKRPDAQEIKSRMVFRGPHSAATRTAMSAARRGLAKSQTHKDNIAAALRRHHED